MFKTRPKASIFQPIWALFLNSNHFDAFFKVPDGAVEPCPGITPGKIKESFSEDYSAAAPPQPGFCPMLGLVEVSENGYGIHSCLPALKPTSCLDGQSSYLM